MPVPSTRRALIAAAMAAAAGLLPAIAQADAVDTLRRFVRDVKTGQANFTQTVTSPDGAKKKTSSGRFQFARPDRFRFVYEKPYEQTLVADGQKVWIHDPDLNQVTSRPIAGALGATPAALLAGGDLDREFELQAQPSQDGIDWVQATPRTKDGNTQWLRVGFRGSELAAIEILDAFGQRSLLQFTQVVQNPTLPPDTFRFTVPAGAEVVAQ